MDFCSKKKPPMEHWGLFLAERVGFEPTVRINVHGISSPAHSTTLPPLRIRDHPGLLGEACDSSVSRCEELGAAQVGPQGGWNPDAAVGLLVVLQHRDQRAPYRQTRAVEGVNQLWLAVSLAA